MPFTIGNQHTNGTTGTTRFNGQTNTTPQFVTDWVESVIGQEELNRISIQDNSYIDEFFNIDIGIRQDPQPQQKTKRYRTEEDMEF